MQYSLWAAAVWRCAAGCGMGVDTGLHACEACNRGPGSASVRIWLGSTISEGETGLREAGTLVARKQRVRAAGGARERARRQGARGSRVPSACSNWLL